HRGDYFERQSPSPSVPNALQESKSSAGASGGPNPRQQRVVSQADSVSNWRRPGAGAAAAPTGSGCSAPSPDKWRGGGGGSRRPPRGAGEGGTRRPGFQSANGDMATGGGSSSMPPSTAAASLDTFDLQRLDPCVQKLVLLLTSPPDPDRAPATVRSLWRANCAQALAELRSVAEQGPDSETAQRVLSPDAVAILLQLLPRLQPGDEAPVGPLQALLAGALISHKISPAEPLTLATVRHLLSRLASSESNSSQDLNSAGANLQLLAALCLNVGQFAQHQGLLRDTIRRLIDRLSRWPTSPDEGETLSGEGDDYNLSACQFYAAQALANLAYLRPTDQRDCLPPDLVSTLLTRCLALLESVSDRPSARVLQLLLHLLTFLIS
uniref:DUF4042 domain-containing protein n=2 Tax=Macrostomum lignano TaxID=282301 RepID=A0A1I8HB53_9PLAT